MSGHLFDVLRAALHGVVTVGNSSLVQVARFLLGRGKGLFSVSFVCHFSPLGLLGSAKAFYLHYFTMALIQNWYPPTKENYDLLLFIWYFFPVVCSHAIASPLTKSKDSKIWLTHKSE